MIKFIYLIELMCSIKVQFNTGSYLEDIVGNINTFCHLAVEIYEYIVLDISHAAILCCTAKTILLIIRNLLFGYSVY